MPAQQPIRACILLKLYNMEYSTCHLYFCGNFTLPYMYGLSVYHNQENTVTGEIFHGMPLLHIAVDYHIRT